jgi:hypothetical protein
MNSQADMKAQRDLVTCQYTESSYYGIKLPLCMGYYNPKVFVTSAFNVISRILKHCQLVT